MLAVQKTEKLMQIFKKCCTSASLYTETSLARKSRKHSEHLPLCPTLSLQNRDTKRRVNWIPNLDKPGQVYWLQGIPGGGKGLCSPSRSSPAWAPCHLDAGRCQGEREQCTVPETALALSCLSWHTSSQSLQCCGHWSGAHRQPLSHVAAHPTACFLQVSLLRSPWKSSKGTISALTWALALGVTAVLLWEVKQKGNFLHLLIHTWTLSTD